MSRRQAEQDFHDSYQFHRRDWAVQRWGWIAMVLFLLAAIAGVFGGGPLSTRTLGDAASGTIEMQRFVRYQAPTILKVTAGSDFAGGGELQIEIDRAYLQAYRIAAVSPEPSRTLGAGGSLRFMFEAPQPRPVITFHLEPLAVGGHSGALRIGASAPVPIEQFIYP